MRGSDDLLASGVFFHEKTPLCFYSVSPSPCHEIRLAALVFADERARHSD
ncbi:MAG: hypothetical protein RI957_684 [Verrucomicrobiota bacterium]|jgi:hypothetical protein